MADLPKARRENLVIRELPDELLVYDLDKDDGHCLNRTAAFVWKHCDGRTSVPEIARRLGQESRSEINEKVIWLALHQLSRKRLLEKPVAAPVWMPGIDRRQMIRVLGVGAIVAVPLITTVVAPTALAAASCFGSGQTCTGINQCCSPLTCSCGTPPTVTCC
jgi:hypothetical protein